VLIVIVVLVAILLIAILAQRVVSPGTATADPVAHKSGFCTTGITERKVTGKVFGIETHKTLFWGKMTEQVCTKMETGAYTSIGPVNLYTGTGTLGDIDGWQYDGVAGGGGPKFVSTDHHTLRTKRILRFIRCVPIPTGCLPNGTYDVKLKLQFQSGNGFIKY
jgi:hypothetical protein